MSAPPKLTKKQKKSLAYRERKTGKEKERDGVARSEDNDVPVLENQDMADINAGQVEMATLDIEKAQKPSATSEKSKGKGRAEEEAQVVDKPKKRKRDLDMALETHEDDKPTKKRTKLPDVSTVAASKEKRQTGLHPGVKQRFILFVGNLKYTTPLSMIKAHFAACDPPPVIRLLTPKPSVPTKPVHKSKGCAFLEFSHRNALQQALKLHQSELDGRMINVELTAGGGGKGENRITKLKERNKELFGQRKDRIEKQGSEGDSTPKMPDRPQRYSATSGIDQAPLVRRTWTVGDVDEGAHRGGKRHSKDKGQRSRGRVWGTGVNAIPVG